MTQDQGPPNQPRLVAGRTELSGLNGTLFVILVIVAFVAGAFLLFNFIVIGAGPATPAPVAVATATAKPTPAPASVEAPGASEPVDGTLLPSEPAINLTGEPVNISVDGNVVGSVTVKDTHWPSQIKGTDPQSGMVWLTVDVTYDASEGDVTYASGDWTVVDASHSMIDPSDVQKAPELGSGIVTSGNTKEGFITFLVPSNSTVTLHFVSGGTTADFKVKPR